jgi:hypothetical protein
VKCGVDRRRHKCEVACCFDGCGNWSPILSEEHRLIVLKSILGPEREEVENRRKMHYEELHDLCSLPNIFRVIKSTRMRWARNVERRGEEKNTYGFGSITVRQRPL